VAGISYEQCCERCRNSVMLTAFACDLIKNKIFRCASSVDQTGSTFDCDITERTGVRRHKTGRRCHKCRAELYDIIVHFGEKGGYQAPYNWKRAARAADHADMILCLGSSLKVKYRLQWNTCCL
jgi:NAD-dependent SIR2 family protein deacetylase